MSTPANVVIKIVPDTSEVTSALDQLQNGGSVSGSDAKSFEAGNTAIQKQTALLAAQAKVYGTVDAAQAKQLPTIKKIEQASNQMATKVIMSAAQFQAGFKASGKSLEEYIKTIGKYKIAAADTSKVVSGVLVNSQSKFNAVLVTNTTAVEANIDAQASLRQELKRLQAQIAQSILNGDTMSDQYQELVQRAGDVKDAMGDAGEAIARAGSDTRAMDNVIDLAQGITAGFAIVQGAAALFGEENEELQKTLLKVNAAMSILNGLQAIQDLLRKEHIKTLLNTIRAQTVSNAQTAIEAGLKSRNIIVTKLATAAQWLLNAAMTANPVGLLVVGVAALTAALFAFSRSADDAAESQEKFNDSLKLDQDYATKWLQTRKELWEQDEKQMKLNGATEAEINKARLAELRDQSSLAAKERDKADKNLQAVQARFKKMREDGDSFNDRDVKNYETAIALKQQADDDAQKAWRSIQNEMLDQQLSAQEKAKEAREKGEQEAKEAREKTEQEIKETGQRRLAVQLSEINNRIAAAKQGSIQELEARKDAIDKQAEIEKNGINRAIQDKALISKEIAAVDQKARLEKQKLDKDFSDKTLQDEQSLAVKRSQLMLEAAKVSWGEYSEQAINAQTLVLAEQARMDEISVQQSTASAEDKAKQIRLINEKLQLDLRQQEIDSMKRQAEINQSQIEAFERLAQDRLKRKASDPRLTDGERYKAQQDVLNKELAGIENERVRIHQQAMDDKSYAEEQYNTDLLNNTNATEQKLQDILNASEERKMQVRRQYAEMANTLLTTAADTYFTIQAQNRQADLDNALARNQAEYDNTVNVKNLTEAQRATIDKKYRQQEANIRNNAARKDRNAQILQASVNGLLSVTNALATVQPWPAAVAAAIIAGASAAANVAAIASKPLPQYEQGTLSAAPGPGIWGEKGTEMSVDRHGNIEFSPSVPTLRVFKGGERVYTAEQTKALQAQNIPVDNSQALSDYWVGGGGSTNLDYDAMGKAMAKHIPAPQSFSVNLDKEGFSMHLLTEGSKTTFLNTRYYR